MQVNYRLAVGLFFVGAYNALRPLLICGFPEKSRLAWNIFGILQLALDLKRRDSAVFFVHSVIFHSAALHCDHCCFVLIKKLYCILFDFV